MISRLKIHSKFSVILRNEFEFDEKEEKDYMGSIAALFMYLMIIGFIAVVAYFVIKKAIKDALKEYNNENNK